MCFHVGWMVLDTWFGMQHAVSVTPNLSFPVVVIRFQIIMIPTADSSSISGGPNELISMLHFFF